MPDRSRYPAARYFGLWARNNAWANHRLLVACGKLPQAEFEAGRTGFFPSLLLTLNHSLAVDRFYVDALEGGGLGLAAFAEEILCRTAGDLARERAAVDRRLIACCEGSNDEHLTREIRIDRGERVQVERADRVLMHLFQHQIHHRGQAHAMLAGTSVPPPQLDEFFPADDAPLREADVAALGWTETGLWS